MRPRLLFLVGTALLPLACVACADVFPKEGQYRCSADGECPSGWACNTAGDGLCYESQGHFPGALDTTSESAADSHSQTDDTHGDTVTPTASDTASDTASPSGGETTGTTSTSTVDTGSASASETGGTDSGSGESCGFAGASFDFEAGDDGFTHGSTFPPDPDPLTDPWALGDWINPCASGSGCFVTEPGAVYEPCTSAALTSPLLDLSGCGARTVTLAFSHAYSFEPLRGGRYRDGGLVQVSGDGGTTWLDVEPSPAYTGLLQGDYNGLCGGLAAAADGHEAWSNGASAGWLSVTLTVPAAAVTSELRFRFLFGSDRAGELLGWAIDDISVTVD